MTFPCQDCLCVAACSNKEYERLFDDCSKISRYLKNWQYMGKRSQWKLEKLNKILNPKNWEMVKVKSRYMIFQRDNANIKFNRRFI